MSTTPCPGGCNGFVYNLKPVLSDDGSSRIIGTCPICGCEEVLDIPARRFRRGNIALIYMAIGVTYTSLLFIVWLFAVACSSTKP